MEVREADQHLGHIHSDEGLWELPEDISDLQEGPILDELHDDVEVVVDDGVGDVVHDVGVVETAQKVDFGHKWLFLIFGARVEFELFDGDKGPSVYVKTLVYDTKTTFPNAWP